MISGDRRLLEPGTEANARLSLQKAQVDELRVFVWGPRNVLGVFGIIIAALFNRFDVVTAQDAQWRGMLGLVAARLGRARLQVQVHGDPRAAGRVGHVLMQVVLWHADAVRAVSEKVKAEVERLGTRVYVDVLPVFVDLEAVAAAHAADFKKEFPRFGKVVLFVGRLEEEKNPKEAIDVFAKIADTFPGAGLVVVGAGSQRASLEAYAHAAGLADHVQFVGYRTDVLSLYKAADAMLVTSPFESFGAAIVEALAAGCPVVSPDVGVAREAGAVVVAHEGLAQATIDVLKSGARGRLKMPLPTKEAWAIQWKNTLTH
jgi:glycosyltransferase involved in cell wall biosynthesis